MRFEPEDTLDSVLYHWEKLLERWWPLEADDGNYGADFQNILGAGKEMVTRGYAVGAIDAVRAGVRE